MHQRYAKDPVRYGHEVLGIKYLTPSQVAVLRHVAESEHVRLLVPSGNETGKSFIAAYLCSWHYDCFRPSLTITTAPSQAQVNDILFRELRRLRKGDPNFSPKAPRLTDGDDHLCVGFTSANATSFQGRHDCSVLVIFDEAEGIAPEFWTASESFATRRVCFYNPTLANSAAAVEERGGKNHIIRMSALDHPNIQREEIGLPPIIPNAVTLHKVLDRLDKWAVRLSDDDPTLPGDVTVAGRRYRPGPVAEARILGRRPTKPVNAVYTTAFLEGMKKPTDLAPHWPVQIGCDVARFGDDFTVMHVRKGRCSLRHETHNGWDTVQTSRRLIELCRDLGKEHNLDPKQIPCVIDEVGVGGGVVDMLRDADFKAVGINTSRKADQEEEYINLRSQIAFDFESLIAGGLVDMSRLPDQATHDIIEQLTAMSYKLGPKGQRVVARKEDIKLILSRSPDDADAVLLAYYQYPETLELHDRS